MERMSLQIGYVNADVIWHYSALHQDPSLISDHMENTRKRFAGSLYHLENDTLLSLVIRLFLSDGHADGISVQGTLGTALSHIDIIFEFIDLDKYESVTCHLNSTRILRTLVQWFIIVLAAFTGKAAAFFTETASTASVAFPSS